MFMCSTVMLKVFTIYLVDDRNVLDTSPGEFVLDMLSERKLSQVDMQFVRSRVNKLVRTTFTKAIEDLKADLKRECCHHSHLLNNVSLKMNGDLFQGLRTQYTQTEYFTSNFGMVMPRKEKLPVRPEDFGRQRAGEPQQFKQQDYVYIPILLQLEQILNIEDIYKETKRKKPLGRGS